MEEFQGNDESTLIKADQLRDMTLTKEEIFEKDKNGLLDTFMGNMVQFATQQGAHQYAANLHEKFDPTMLTEISKEFENLGYQVQAGVLEEEKVGKFIQLVVSWNDGDTPLTPTAE